MDSLSAKSRVWLVLVVCTVPGAAPRPLAGGGVPQT